jgi:hypothetical protein
MSDRLIEAAEVALSEARLELQKAESNPSLHPGELEFIKSKVKTAEAGIEQAHVTVARASRAAAWQDFQRAGGDLSDFNAWWPGEWVRRQHAQAEHDRAQAMKNVYRATL